MAGGLSLSVSGDEPVCDCEKIIKEGKCDNPDCIKICNLQSVLDSASQVLQEKCLKKIKTRKNKKEKFKEEELFSAEAVKGTSVKSLLDKKKETFKTIDQENKRIIKNSCHGCYLQSKVDAKIIPQTKKEKCDKHIQTEKYELWRKHSMNDSTFCDTSEDSKGLCELKDEYEYCCPKQYLKIYKHSLYIKNPGSELANYFESQKSWNGKYPKNMAVKNSSTCVKENINLMNAYINNYVKALLAGKEADILKKDGIDFSKKIWTDCPTGCSFAINYVKNINSNQCSGDLNIVVGCTHRKKTKWTGNPLYNIAIEYKGDVKCQ